jgi:hypothetical protein
MYINVNTIFEKKNVFCSVQLQRFFKRRQSRPLLPTSTHLCSNVLTQKSSGQRAVRVTTLASVSCQHPHTSRRKSTLSSASVSWSHELRLTSINCGQCSASAVTLASVSIFRIRTSFAQATLYGLVRMKKHTTNTNPKTTNGVK